MAHGRSKLYGGQDVAEAGDVSAAVVSLEPATDAEAYQEIDTLKSINAQLIRQIQALKESEAHAQQLADRDGLTGLYNRRRMLELLEQSLDDARSRGGKVGLLFVDLDGFKAINDRHGHAIGDRLLMIIAARISARARAADFVCRYGGDEFVVILPTIAGGSDIEHVADSIRERIGVPCRCDGAELTVSASVGEALFPDQGTTAQSLLEAADQSMYREKAHGSASQESLRQRRSPSRRHDDGGELDA